MTSTPLHWQMLFHYYAIAEPYAIGNPGHASSLAVQAYTKALVDDDLIKIDPTSGSGYRVTDRGDALIDYVLRLPLPEKIWRVRPLTPPQCGEPK